MNRLLTVGAALSLCAFAAHAGQPPQVTQATTVRVGGPLQHDDAWSPSTSTAAVNPAALGQPMSPADDPVLDASLPKLFFDAGQPITLEVRLRTRGGAAVPDATITVADTYTRNENDQRGGQPQQLKGVPHGHQYQVTLDTTPGKHELVITADATYRGQQVHRATTHSYTVATGAVRITDVGKARTEGPMVVVPLQITATRPTYANISGVLTAGAIAVANAQVGAFIDTGPSTLDLTFRQADLVEPGPYQLTNVLVMSNDTTRGSEMAAAPGSVGHPFNVNGGGHGKEPQPPTDESGQVVGGPYGKGAEDDPDAANIAGQPREGDDDQGDDGGKKKRPSAPQSQ